ncbi:glutamate-cysteine ligase family protein [Kitasatospora sp. NPDC008050]|uniref:carboxylate-amine ligase n=1 Tax=Kitasatospora sp. NPDC008050 TaxID=3364021 RepID=UPI0036ED934B
MAGGEVMRRLRFGVEEEYLLTDPVTGRTVPRAPAVLGTARQALGERAQPEFLASQIEAGTSPVATAEELHRELVAIRRAMAAAARRSDCLLIASGTAVLPSRHPLTVTGEHRYRRVAEHIGALADSLGAEICGCHVHLGDLSRAEALRLSARLRPWLPALQAAAAAPTTSVPCAPGTARWPRWYGSWPGGRQRPDRMRSWAPSVANVDGAKVA